MEFEVMMFSPTEITGMIPSYENAIASHEATAVLAIIPSILPMY
jgi:hypothetical protein